MKNFCFALLALAAALLCSPASVAATVRTVKIESETPAYLIDIEYPQIGVKAIDDDIAQWATAQAGEIMRAVRTRQAHQGQYSLEMGFDIARNDGQMFEVVFNISRDYGFIRPSLETASLNYLMPEGARFLLPEALLPGAFKRLSELTIADINRRAVAAGGDPPDPDLLRLGAAPHPMTFRSFAFTTTELVLYFGAGHLDAPIAGPLEAHIPLAKLNGLLRADWRKPLPGFDCAKAATAVEKAICADRVLARLDRQVAEEYASVLRRAELMGKPIPAIKDAQRAFIAKRDKDCEGVMFGQIGKCLSTAYTARLAALQKAFE